MGRKAGYSTQYRAAVIERLSKGETLRQICKSEGYPNEATVRAWAQNDAEFLSQYTHARTLGFDAIAEEVIEISDQCRLGAKTEEKHIGWSCPKCRLPVRWVSSGWVHTLADLMTSPLCEGIDKPDRITETKIVSGDMVERARLQVDARKWLLSKLRPDKYGDKTSVELSGSLTTMTLAETLRARRAARTGEKTDAQ